MNASKALILDVDHVVFKHERALQHVGKRATKFVQKQLPLKVGLLEAQQINQKLYQGYGHTILGLRAVFAKHAPSLYDFNCYVYDNDMLGYVEAIKHKPEIVTYKDEVRALLDTAKNNEVPIFLFSNAPFIWCKLVASVMGINDYVPEDDMFSCTHAVFQDGHLKPQDKVYECVKNLVQHKYRDKDMKLIYVDDSFQNLIPVIGKDAWMPVHLDGNKGGRIKSANIHTVHALQEVRMLL